MKVYIQTDKDGEFQNINAFAAYLGFAGLGWEIFKYHLIEDIEVIDPEIVVVGGIGNIRGRLAALGVDLPADIDYPDELKAFLGRKVWLSTLGEALNFPIETPIFVKPLLTTKLFTGIALRSFQDRIGLAKFDSSIKVYCSEIVNFRTEWRCFIRYGKILDIRPYYGAWDSKLDLAVVEAAIAAYKSAPAAYSLDFGMDDQGQMRLVEVNDGHSLGTYGMTPVLYAKFLSARWAELTQTEDYANF